MALTEWVMDAGISRSCCVGQVDNTLPGFLKQTQVATATIPAHSAGSHCRMPRGRAGEAIGARSIMEDPSHLDHSELLTGTGVLTMVIEKGTEMRSVVQDSKHLTKFLCLLVKL